MQSEVGGNLPRNIKASFRRIISLPTSYYFSIKQLSSDGLLQLTENTGTNKFIL